MNAYLHGVQFALPQATRSNDDLVALNPDWNAEQIYKKTGIRSRRIAASDETASDLGCTAAATLMDELNFDRGQIDAVLFCTQSPDYFMPATACILQHRLKLATTCAAFDFNLGCSGFTYGLWMARCLIAAGEARNVLLIVGDTISRYCDVHDLTTAAIFGDGAGAALIGVDPTRAIATLGPSIVGTDGRGAPHLIVPGGCARGACGMENGRSANGDGVADPIPRMHMNGPEVFSFTVGAVQAGIQQLLDRVQLDWSDVDLFFLHQANRFMLEQLRGRMKIPADKMPIDLEETGNTVSATLPILLRNCLDRGMLHDGAKCVLAGFGVGYSWAMTYLTWGSPHPVSSHPA